MIPHWVSFSVVIPCYNDGRRLFRNANKLHWWALSHNVEVIVVDDGSDDSERKFLKSVCSDNGFRLLHHSVNRGKWAAMRTGALEAKNSHVVLCDADFSVTPWETVYEYKKQCNHFDVMLGDRNKLQSGIPFYRRLYGWAFNKIVQLVLGRVFWKCRDTQCPSKVFSKSLMLIASMEEEGFVGDVEWILRYHQAGYPIRVVDVHYVNDTDSKVHPFRDGSKMFEALFRIHKRWC